VRPPSKHRRGNLVALNDDLGGEPEEQPTTRRELLERAGAAGAAALGAVVFGKLAESEAERDSDPAIVVVGAGLAGLTCAWRLQQVGLHADVYEASSRVGGRCRTRRGDFADDQTVEAGGELIDETHVQIQLLAQELGLELDDLTEAGATGTDELFFVAGEPYPAAEARDDLRRVDTQSLALDHLSLSDWIEQNVPGGADSRLGRLLALASAVAFGADPGAQTSFNLLELLNRGGDERLLALGPWHGRYRVRGGNDELSTRMTAHLGSQIHTGCKLLAIELGTDSSMYSLTFEQRSGGAFDVDAEHVVLALPFSSLRSSVDWAKAGFEPLKQTAVRELGMGSHAKLHLQFSTRYWHELRCNGTTLADTGPYATWEATRAQDGGSGILAAFTDGTAEELLGRIEPVLPGSSELWNGKAAVDLWPESRSYLRVGQHAAFAGIEGARQGNCHFAGEHTSVDFRGTLNGAVESGEQAAAEIVGDLT
jgi:monoamine oxidase